jgi:hypothetical protein
VAEDADADAEESNRKPKKPEPPNEEIDEYIEKLAQNDPDDSSKVDRAKFALLDRPVLTTGVGYIDVADKLLYNMSEAWNGTSKSNDFINLSGSSSANAAS